MADAHAIAIGTCAVAFLLGSVPFGVLMSRLFGDGKDVRTHGSGNIGATNVTRVHGFWPAGALTFLLDAGKGVLVAALASPNQLHWAFALAGRELPPDMTVLLPGLAAFFVTAGHCFTPWLKFKGGKGVATAFGAAAWLSPIAAGVGLACFGVAFLEKRVGSLASLAGLLGAVAAHLVISPDAGYLWPAGAMVLLVMYRHESNLRALLDRRESSF